MNKIFISAISLAVGAAVSWFITKKVYDKKINNLVASTNEEVEAMHKQLSELHKTLVDEQPTTVALENQKKWDEIAKTAGSKVGATYAPKTDDQVVEEFRANIEAANVAPTPSFAEYKEEAAKYIPDEIQNDGPTIYEITAEEYYHGDPGYTKTDLDLYMLEEDVYDTDTSERIDGLTGFIGMTVEELMDRIDIYYDDDTTEDEFDKDHLYFRNENITGDFEVHVHREGNSPYYDTMIQ